MQTKELGCFYERMAEGENDKLDGGGRKTRRADGGWRMARKGQRRADGENEKLDGGWRRADGENCRMEDGG